MTKGKKVFSNEAAAERYLANNKFWWVEAEQRWAHAKGYQASICLGDKAVVEIWS